MLTKLIYYVINCYLISCYYFLLVFSYYLLPIFLKKKIQGEVIAFSMSLYIFFYFFENYFQKIFKKTLKLINKTTNIILDKIIKIQEFVYIANKNIILYSRLLPYIVLLFLISFFLDKFLKKFIQGEVIAFHMSLYIFFYFFENYFQKIF